MALRLREHLASQTKPEQGLGRRLARVVLLAAILVLAWLQGYSARGWILIGLLVLWAASLPYLLRGLGRQLERSTSLSEGQRRALIVVLALLLLAGFAAGAMLLLR